MPLDRYLRIKLLHLEDYLRTRNAAALAALGALPSAYLNPVKERQRQAAVRVASYYPDGGLGRVALARAKALSAALNETASLRKAVSISRSAIVKPYVSRREPGFLVVSFEGELQKLMDLEGFADLEREYRIIFLPTWQPFYSVALCRLAARSSKTFFVMPSAFAEERLCQEFSGLCYYLPFHAASWVRGDFYADPARAKTIDILMLANFARHKRHWKLLEALRSVSGARRVVLAGVPMGKRSSDALREEAALFGVQDRIEIVEAATDTKLREILRDSRLLCAMTHKEGSCIAVAEALMAGVPVAMFAKAKIGSKSYVNEQTGFLLDADEPLGPQLENALAVAPRLEPQAWARREIAAEVNSRKLDKLLKQWASSEGLDWTRGINPFYCQHFEFRYFSDEAERRIEHEYARLREAFGLTLRR
jgi:glycosyltransferase involved in cell wall biosynthesis